MILKPVILVQVLVLLAQIPQLVLLVHLEMLIKVDLAKIVVQQATTLIISTTANNAQLVVPPALQIVSVKPVQMVILTPKTLVNQDVEPHSSLITVTANPALPDVLSV
jgi:hypothetical protein